MAKAAGDDARMRSVKSREKKLNDRMGLEKSAKGGRFKLNRDLEGYHLTSRADIVVEKAEMELTWKIPPPPEIKGGTLISLEGVSVGYGQGKKVVLEGVGLTIHPRARLAIVGSVSPLFHNFDERGPLLMKVEWPRQIDSSNSHYLRPQTNKREHHHPPFLTYRIL
jgi:hypothetical protein